MAHFNQAIQDPCVHGRVSVRDGTENLNGRYLMRAKEHIKDEGREPLHALLHWDIKQILKKRRGRADLEEQAKKQLHPESTLLQTWGHLNICLQHVRREFNQSPAQTCTIVSGNKY